MTSSTATFPGVATWDLSGADGSGAPTATASFMYLHVSSSA